MTKKTEKCPVCNKKANNTAFVSKYHIMKFYFCSKQCKNEFESRSGYYVKSSIQNSENTSHNLNTNKTVYDSNKEMIAATKTRIIQLDEPLSIETITLLKSVLLSLIGVQSIKINITNIYVTYQLKHIKETRIEVALDELEMAIKNKWFERLRYRLLHQYAEKEIE